MRACVLLCVCFYGQAGQPSSWCLLPSLCMLVFAVPLRGGLLRIDVLAVSVAPATASLDKFLTLVGDLYYQGSETASGDHDVRWFGVLWCSSQHSVGCL